MDINIEKYAWIIVIAVLFATLFASLDNLSYPHLNQDGNRDYLVGRHINNYGEFPINGPSGQFPNSPFYYYLIAAFLLLNGEIMFLGIVNIILQMANIFIVYLLAKNIFGIKTGLISVVLFGFSNIVFSQVNFIWQPYVMQPFLHLSLLLLLLSHIRKNFSLLACSIFTFVTAGVLNNPAFGLTLPFLTLAFLIIRKWQFDYAHFILAGSAFIGSLAIYYLPLFWSNLVSFNIFSSIISKFSIRGDEHFLINFYDRTSFFINQIFVNDAFRSQALIAAIFLSIIYFIYQRKSENFKYAIILFISIFYFLIVSSIFNVGSIPFPERYFTPITGLFIILMAELIRGVSLSLKFPGLASVILALTFLIQFSSLEYKNLASSFRLKASVYEVIIGGNSGKVQDPLINGVIEEILIIKEKEEFSDLDFFQFKSYYNGMEFPYIESVFWSPLEIIFQRKFVKVSDTDIRGFTPLNSDEYIFLVCPTGGRCFDIFSHKYLNYIFVKDISATASAYRVHLFKKDVNWN